MTGNDHLAALWANTAALRDHARDLREHRHALNRNTAALTALARQEKTLMADLTALTDVVSQISADDSALKTSIDGLVAAFQAAQSGGFTPQNQAALDAAVTALTQAHTNLQADAQAAVDAVTPPTPPAP